MEDVVDDGHGTDSNLDIDIGHATIVPRAHDAPRTTSWCGRR